MNKVALIFFVVFAAGARAGESFDDKVQLAESLEKTTDGQAYQDVMWPITGPALAELLHDCVPDDPALEGQAFKLLVTISADGEALDSQVQPRTKVTSCVANGVMRLQFPKPPQKLSAGGMPLVFVLHIHTHKP